MVLSRKILTRRFNYISLLYLLLLTAKVVSGQSACQGTPQTITISRGQKIAVVYWIGDNQLEEDSEKENTTPKDIPTTTIAPLQPDEVKESTIELTTAEPELTTAETSVTVLDEAVEANITSPQQVETEEPTVIDTTLQPKFDSDENQNETLSSRFDKQNEENSTELIGSKGEEVETDLPVAANDTVAPEEEADNNQTIQAKSGLDTVDNSTLLSVKSNESDIESIVGRNGELTTALPETLVDSELDAKNSDNSSASDAEVTNNITDILTGRNDFDLNKTTEIEGDQTADELTTLSGRNFDDDSESSTISGRSDVVVDVTTEKLVEARLVDDQQLNTEIPTVTDESVDVNNNFRSVDEAVTEVEYWSTTPGFEEEPNSALKLARNEPPIQQAIETVTEIEVEQNVSATLISKSADLNDSGIDSGPIIANLQEIIIANPELESTISSLNEEFTTESVTENLQDVTDSELQSKSLLDSLISTIKPILKNILSSNEETTFSPVENFQEPALTTAQSADEIIFREVTKDPEIYVDPRIRNRYNITDAETPPTITIMQLGDESNQEPQELAKSEIQTEIPEAEVENVEVTTEDFEDLPATTIVSVLQATIDEDDIKEEARTVDGNLPNFEFIPLDVIEGQRPIYIQRSPASAYVPRQRDSDSQNEYFVPTSSNGFRLPQSRVHYVSMLRPPDGILPIQSLNLDPSFRKRKRVLQRGGRTKRELNGTNCEWIFKSEPGVPLLLTFKSFSTPETENCKDHFISVERESNGFISRWCGVSGNKPGHAAFARSEIRLQLHSSGDGSFPTGFAVEVQALDLKLLRKYAEVRRIIKSH
ncbi:hypothetical protein CHUAL_002200 [Chamberlinius hualienensis]